MAISDLTQDQQNTVSAQARSQASLPAYYNAKLRTNVQISRDFEAFLILSDTSIKSTAIQWVQQAVTLNQQDKKRDALLAIATANELSNATARLNECNTQLDSYTKFRASFTVPQALDEDSDLQLFLNDIQNVIGNLITQYDRAFFDQTVATLLQNSLSPGQVTSDQVEELQSWTSVIAAYLG